jgi:hypothetical protein
MTNLPFKRLVFITTTVALVFAALFAESFVFNHLDHNCEGGHCPTCLQIQIIRSFLDALRRAGVITFFPIVLLVNAAARRTLFRAFPATLVLLKVKSST